MTSPMSEPRRYSNAQRGGYPASYEKIMEAMNKGAVAVNDNAPVSSCPYLGDRTEQGRFLALMWYRAYRKRRLDLAAQQSPPPTPASGPEHSPATEPSQSTSASRNAPTDTAKAIGHIEGPRTTYET